MKQPLLLIGLCLAFAGSLFSLAEESSFREGLSGTSHELEAKPAATTADGARVEQERPSVTVCHTNLEERPMTKSSPNKLDTLNCRDSKSGKKYEMDQEDFAHFVFDREWVFGGAACQGASPERAEINRSILKELDQGIAALCLTAYKRANKLRNLSKKEAAKIKAMLDVDSAAKLFPELDGRNAFGQGTINCTHRPVQTLSR